MNSKNTFLITAQELSEKAAPYLKYIKGSLSNKAHRPLPPEFWQDSHMVFVSDSKNLTRFIDLNAPIIICLENALPQNIENIKKSTLFTTTSISAGLAVVHQFFDDKLTRFTSGIHPTALVSPSAQIAKDAHVGPYAIIGDEAQVGSKTRIGSHAVVEKNARVGNNCILHPHVFIGADCQIGNYCEVHPHTSIGSDGFGYAKDPKGIFHKIPQLGNVVIEDHVEIGSNCAIDRAAMHSTIIRTGTKLDNLIHIAHNCDVGEHSAIAAGFMVAGSTKIGKGLTTGGDVVIGDHLHIADNVTLGGRTAVTRHIDEPGTYVGFPVEPYSKGMKIMATLSSLPDIKRQVSKIMKHLGLDKEEQ